MTLEDQMKKAREYETDEVNRSLLVSNVLLMNMAFEKKDYKNACWSANVVVDIENDNSMAKFILFWSNYRLEIINNRNALVFQNV
jgi:hypothetical protein